MQALILAGGQATRLRPLTSRVPKLVVPLAGQPFIGYMLEWLCSHGVDDVIMSCGFLADGVRAVLGDGSDFGVRLRYVEEPEPLGTGGALKYAEELLDERFFMLNGDGLTDIDLTAQLAQHERTGARATLGLIPVEDPSAYGLVRCRPDASVLEFVEKPGPDQVVDTNLVSGGIYILEREVLTGMAPAGTNSSIERDLFPKLVGQGLYGCEASGYWMDIGTPSRYLQATYDILDGKVNTKVGARLNASGMRLLPEGGVPGRIAAPVLIDEGCVIAPNASIGGRVVLGRGVQVGAGASIEDSVLLDGVTVGARTHIGSAIISRDVVIGQRCTIDGHVMLGEGVRIGDDNMLTAGARVFPGVELPDGAIRFLSSGRTLSREAVAEVDVSGQFAEVLALPDHLRDALWRVESANLRARDSPGGLVIAGVGGSSAGGALARAALGDAASRPIALARDYALPGWTTPDTTVLCASYSGDTEETLAAYDAAQALGARTIVVTTGGKLAEQARIDGVPVVPLPGGFESRAAVGYSLVVALEVAALCGAGESMRAEVDVAAEHAASLAAAWGPDSAEGTLAKTLARGLHGTIPQIAGAALTAPVAYRWKTQINENAKAPAFAAELPELDHNELVGWDGASEFGSFSAVFLDDSDLHPRVRQRVELTRGLIASRGGATFRIESIGQTRLQRLVSLVLLGDLVSLYLAALRGVDPGPVTAVDSLRSALNGAE